MVAWYKRPTIERHFSGVLVEEGSSLTCHGSVSCGRNSSTFFLTCRNRPFIFSWYTQNRKDTPKIEKTNCCMIAWYKRPMIDRHLSGVLVEEGSPSTSHRSVSCGRNSSTFFLTCRTRPFVFVVHPTWKKKIQDIIN